MDSNSNGSGGNKDRDKRFEALLRPIRDLAANWSIDVARDLEEYLEDLEHIAVSFDGGRTSLNFAEAALVIQGSACVYSRKVEYLYALTNQTLDILHARAKRGKKRVAAALAAGDADADALEEAEEEFLLLDDAIKEASTAAITMKESRDALVTTLNMSMHYAGGGFSSPHQRAAAASVMARTPLAVIAAQGFNRREPGYRIATLSVGKSGSLLLDAAPLGGRTVPPISSLLDLSIAPIEASQVSAADGPITNNVAVPGDGGIVNVLSTSTGGDDMGYDGGYDFGSPGYADDTGVAATSEDAPSSTVDVAGTASAANSAPRPARTGRASRAAIAAPAPLPDKDAWAQLDAFADAAPSACKPFRKARTFLVLKDPAAISRDGPLVAAADAIAKANANGGRGSVAARSLAARAQIVASRAAALRTTGGISSGGEKGAKAGHAAALSMALAAMACPSTESGGMTASSVVSKLSASSVEHYNMPVFSELDELARKQRSAVSRARLSARRARSVLRQDDIATGGAYDLGHDAVDDDNDGGFGTAFDAGRAGSVDPAMDDMDGPADYDIAMDLPVRASAGSDEGLRPHALFGVLEDSTADDPFYNQPSATGVSESLATAFTQDPDAAAYARAVHKYMHHINAFIRDTKAAAQTSAITKRVDEWQEKLMPVLEEEEQRREFDIHAYGADILETMSKQTVPETTAAPSAGDLPFANIVPAPQRYEVCRTFLAMLQLANTGNVDIVRDEAEDEIVVMQTKAGRRKTTAAAQEELLDFSETTGPLTRFHVKLLSGELPHEAIRTFIAPSAHDSIQTTGHVGEGFTSAAASASASSQEAAAPSKRQQATAVATHARKQAPRAPSARSKTPVQPTASEDEATSNIGEAEATAAPDVSSPAAKRGRAASRALASLDANVGKSNATAGSTKLAASAASEADAAPLPQARGRSGRRA